MSNSWIQVFRGRASVYALDEDTKQWADRGTSGIVIMFQSSQNGEDVRIKWEKNQKNHRDVWWRLTSSKLKPKGERALVLKAWATQTNQQEILAIRFSHQEAAIQFAKKYHNIFPMAISGNTSIENIFKQSQSSHSNHSNAHNSHHNNQLHQNSGQHLKPKHHLSMASLPGSVLGDEDPKQFVQFQPHYNQQLPVNPNNYNGNNNNNNNSYQQHEFENNNGYINNNNNNNNNYKNHRSSNPPPPPQRRKKLPPPRPSAQSQYVHNGQIVNEKVLSLQQQQEDDNNKPLPDEPSKPMVKASPDMRPPVFSRPLPNIQCINNDPVGLEYGGLSQWKCAVCTYQNNESSGKCSMCGLPKKPAPKPVLQEDGDDDDIYDDPSGLGIGAKPAGPVNNANNANNIIAANNGDNNKWQCKACTFSNHSWTDRCEVCSAKRRIEPEKPKNLILPKKDEAMTLHNEMSQQIKERQMEDMNPIGSPLYNSIPQKRFVFDNGVQNQQPWSCPICTLLNSYKNARCEACNSDRNVNPYHGLNAFNDQNNVNINDVNDMMNHMINKPEQKYENEQEYDDDYQKMLNIGMGVHGNPYNINLQYDYNNPFQAVNINNNINTNFFESTVCDFSRAASDIACYNDSPSSVFSTLRSVAKKLLKDDARYRTLDTTNPKVMERLIGFEGVLDFLMLLGFESDAMGMKLICQKKPSSKVVHNAITVLNSYQQRFRMTDNGMDSYQMQQIININNIPASFEAKQINETQGGFSVNAVNSVNNDSKNDILTLEQIILWSTHENMQDNDTMETLIMTHKMFTDSLTLLKQLRKRFFVPIPTDILSTTNVSEKQLLIKEFQTGVQKRIQLKVIKALRDWMKHYWSEDFDKNESVQSELTEWLKELSVYNQLDIHNVNCVWIGKLYDAVKKEYFRLKQIDWDRELEKQLDILSLYENDGDIGDINKMNTILSKSTAEELADQITLMDYRLFSRIEPRECVHQRWKDQNNKKLAPNILSLIQQFNNFTIFIQIQILRERSLKKRGTAIKRIIKMGEHFKLTRNYNSLCAVFSALNSAPIHRLKLAWNRVPERNRQMFEEWSIIFCRDFNHRNLRQLLRKAGGNPCIPHIGVFLQDLVFIDEGNKKKVAIEAFNGNQMLNFNKCVRIADRIKNLQLFQHHKYENTQIKENRLTQKIILTEFEKLKDVTEDQIWDMSTEIKKQDQREAKQPLHPFFGGGSSKNKDGLNQIPPVQPAQQ